MRPRLRHAHSRLAAAAAAARTPQRKGAGMAGDLGMKVTLREKMAGAGEEGTLPAAPGTACGCATEAARLATG